MLGPAEEELEPPAGDPAIMEETAEDEAPSQGEDAERASLEASRAASAEPAQQPSEGAPGVNVQVRVSGAKHSIAWDFEFL